MFVCSEACFVLLLARALVISAALSIDHQEELQRRKEMRRRISSQQQYAEDAISGHAPYTLFGQWAGQRTARHASQRSQTKPSAFGVSFHKCAQVESGGGVSAQVQVRLQVSNPQQGGDLSQLCIRDSVSGVTLLQPNSSVQERGFQTFSADSLRAGSQYVVLYRMSVKGNRDQILNLPAYLTFSNATQNDIHLFGPVIANFTVRINTTEQAGVDRSLLLVGFVVSFLLTLLLVSLGVVSVNFLRRRRLRSCAPHTRNSINEEAGPYECDITAAANEEAAFEDKFVDIVMLEDPQNMIQALDSLQVSCVLRAAVWVERVRVQMFKGLLSVLLAGVRAAGRLSDRGERRVLGVVHGQIVGMEGKVQEEHVARMAALAAQCNLETQEEMETQQRKHMSETAHAERLFQHAPRPQDVLEVRSLLEKLHKEELKRLQKLLLIRHEHASAQAQRQQALRRRFELHKIFGEELEEAVRTGELEKSTADKLQLQYYSRQDALEEVLDVLLANQRALLAERHAQRRFLLQSFQSLQAVTSEAFSSSARRIRDAQAHGECGFSQQCSDVQLEILRVKQSLEESVSRERSAIRCDIIKRRRQLLSEKVCEHWSQLQAASASSDVTADQYLQRWTQILMYQNNELSELISRLDEETAGRMRKMSLCLLQSLLAELKAHTAASCPGAAQLLPQTEEVQERLQRLGKEAARELRSTQSCIRQQQQQELQEQRSIRDAFREYCSCVCACLRSLSREQRLRLQLECVKAACRLSRCLALPHAVCELKRHDADPSDPAVTPADEETERSEVTELQCFQRRLQERLQQSDTQSDTPQQAWHEACVFQEQQLRVCQECVAVFVASLQWEHAEKKTKVTETHTALLQLQTLLRPEILHADLTHNVNTHRLALEEAELQLQQEELKWEESVDGRGCSSSDDDDDEEEDVLMADGGVAAVLQEALFRRQCLTDRVLRRNQTLEHQKDRLQLKRLQTYCEQDLEFTAALVKQSLMSVPDLHKVLRLLLPTVPEGELLSLIDALGPGAGVSGSCSSLADRLRHDVLSRNLSDAPQHRDRFLKKRQKLLDKLLSGAGGSGDAGESQRRRRRKPELPVPEPSEETEAGPETRGGEGAWPESVAQDSLVSMRDDSEGVCPEGEGAWSVGVAQDSLVSMRDDSEGVCPEGEGAWSVGVAQDSLVSMRVGSEEVCPGGMAAVEGVWPVGVAPDRLVSAERLFVFRCVPPAAQQHTQSSRSRKKRNFLNFKKSSVAPQPNT
ncbi:limbin isoform X2 [Onychostoma macrolepis]|uniref:limbin isoform X2 n=1 Tax=Onychostoma macrolepis TaxID=369639 RepID=UPI00272D736A|nr:limbin isoform X2 [Onychostoma macrolepis]